MIILLVNLEKAFDKKRSKSLNQDVKSRLKTRYGLITFLGEFWETGNKTAIELPTGEDITLNTYHLRMFKWNLVNWHSWRSTSCKSYEYMGMTIFRIYQKGTSRKRKQWHLSALFTINKKRIYNSLVKSII